MECVPRTGCLDVHYFGTDFEKGYPYRTSGPFSIHFDNVHHFRGKDLRFDLFERLNTDVSGQLGECVTNNIISAKKLFVRVATQTTPEHTVLVTDGTSLNPLYFHMVFHSRLSGYIFDVRKILQLHSRGGGYFYEGFYPYSDRAYRSEGSYQGRLRTPGRAEEIREALDLYASRLDIDDPTMWDLSDEEVFTSLTNSQGIELGRINEGYIWRTRHF